MNATRRTPSFDRGGDRNYDRLPAAEKAAIDFINWATEQGYRRETGVRVRYAADAARYLRRMAPERFTKAVAAYVTRPDDTYAALVGLADEAAAR